MTDKIKALIIDDEPASTHLLSTMLGEIPKIGKIYSVNDSVEGFEKIKELEPDILFLDINMPKLSGIDILRLKNTYKLHVHVVIISAYKEQILDAAKYDIIDYLLKPFDREAIDQVIEIYQNHMDTHDQKQMLNDNKSGFTQKIRIPTSFEELYFDPDEIYYLEAQENYTNIITPEGKRIVSSFNLGRIQKMLPTHIFYRISRKVIINYKYLQKIDKRKKLCILNHHGKEIPYSRNVIIRSGLLS